nr:MAG TPA_asm: hypothetical protein [Caudoviricetes sp.]
MNWFRTVTLSTFTMTIGTRLTGMKENIISRVLYTILLTEALKIQIGGLTL